MLVAVGTFDLVYSPSSSDQHHNLRRALPTQTEIDTSALGDALAA